jgi:hypothetical protein
MSEFEKALRRKILSMIPDSSIVGKVTKVDESNFTCNVMPLDNDAELFKVRLKPTIDNVKKGIIAIPSVDSYVIIGFLKNKDTNPFVIWCSNFEKYYMFGEGGNTFEFKDDGTILINGDTFDGVPKVQVVTDEINDIKTDINTLKAAFTAWIVIPSDGGAALKAAAASWAGQILTPAVKTDLENAKVKHGAGN